MERIELDRQEASDLGRWLSAEGSSLIPLSAGYQGAVYLYKGPNGHRIIKKPLGSGLRYRLGCYMLQREFQAYHRLQGIAGVPHCFGMLHDQFLVLEYIEGKGLRELDNCKVDQEKFFASLLEIIKKMHAVGVSHNDLKRKDNVLISKSGKPVLLDFGLSYLRLRDKENFFFRLLKRMDYNSWIKIKYHRRVSMISNLDSAYYRPTILENAYRIWRKLWKIITFRRWRRKSK
jgi:predicted Ser/Thr protein kinase